MTGQGTPVNNEQAINQWQDTWQDHMTNRESHERHGTWQEQTNVTTVCIICMTPCQKQLFYHEWVSKVLLLSAIRTALTRPVVSTWHISPSLLLLLSDLHTQTFRVRYQTETCRAWIWCIQCKTDLLMRDICVCLC